MFKNMKYLGSNHLYPRNIQSLKDKKLTMGLEDGP